MSYRLPELRGHLSDLGRQSIICVDNGTISSMTIPCFYDAVPYFDRRHRLLHDHVGWPSPNHPDQSCQLPPGYDRHLVMNEIDLAGEGYNFVEVVLDDPPTGLVVSGTIEQNMVRLNIAAMCNSAKLQDVDTKFAVYIIEHGNAPIGEDTTKRRDLVTKGILRVVAGVI